MTSRSFKQDLGRRPLRYRTPSPPRAAVESLSPLFAEDVTVENGGIQWPSKKSASYSTTGSSRDSHDTISHKRCNGGSDSQGAMDAFASIALATSSQIAARRSSHQEPVGSRSGMIFALDDGSSERPAKRARSEKLPSPQSRRSGIDGRLRPATSHEQSSDSRMLEAELLLNFAQEARFSVPPRSMRQEEIRPLPPKPFASPTIHGGTPLLQPATDAEVNDQAADKSESREHMRVHECSTVTYSDEASGEPDPSSLAHHPPLVSQCTSVLSNEAALQKQQARSERGPDIATEEQAMHGSVLDFASPEKESHSAGYEPPISSTLTHVGTETNDKQTEDKEGLSAHESIGSQPQVTHQLANEVEAADTVHAKSKDEKANKLPYNTSAIHVTPNENLEMMEADTISASKTGDVTAPAVCAGCGFMRNIVNGEIDPSPTSWISCDACKAWYHFACAGFKNEREVRSVDKYRCKKCKPTHGPTTYVRKSSRAHSSIDYAGLHQGVIKTSDDTPEHHYIQPIKGGTISFQPESFARMRPELVTAEYFEQREGWREPIVIPAAFNPQPRGGSSAVEPSASNSKQETQSDGAPETTDEWAFDGSEAQYAPDHGQDALDMVMPQGLTVRTVAELYGLEEKVEVIDVKSQNGEGKKWNMRRWADYYENQGNKVVRNVISLEVSQSRLGRLIRRPQIVRDLDLQDSVWPAELQAKGEIPRVQFYCLMSVADCFTDFHIDFGGSSVFYHILKGKKTFFFIPPKEKHLKKYEEWCLSPAQNWTFLGSQTKECYRVDLLEGDTMLIPAGWIHAVWTPEDSLVIGGNFLTRLNYGMQLRIAQIEKATGVARKFRYPHFQKIQWYTAYQYLEQDPLPNNVRDLLQGGGVFHRESPTYYGYNEWGENSRSGPENYHARYYSQSELEGLPDLVRYILRTALIDMGSITDGITAETRNAVKRSIPRGHGEPLDVVKTFAAWCAWKRGEETIPSWAYPDAVPEAENAGKISAAAQKKLDREAALQAPRRQSARMQSLQQSANAISQVNDGLKNSLQEDAVENSTQAPAKRRLSDQADSPGTQASPAVKRRRTISGSSSMSHRKVACESCRKRRRACKHKEIKDSSNTDPRNVTGETGGLQSVLPRTNSTQTPGLVNGVTEKDGAQDLANNEISETLERVDPSITMQQLMDLAPDATLSDADREKLDMEMDYLLKHPDEIASTPKMLTHLSGAGLMRLEHRIAGGPVNGLSVLSLNAPHSRGRTKACNDCRKSKRRCIHDEYGNEDPVKAREAAMPRPATVNKRRKLDSEGNEIPSAKKLRRSTGSITSNLDQPLPNDPVFDTSTLQQAPVANMLVSRAGEDTLEQQDMSSAFDQIEAAATATTSNDTVAPEPPLDPEHDAREAEHPPVPAARSNTSMVEPAPEIPPGVPAAHPVASTPPDSKDDITLDSALTTSSQLAASLVSPPPSEHQDASDLPPTPSRSVSHLSQDQPEHSATQPKHQPQQQRYTPDSGSSSSTNDAESGRASSGPTTLAKDVSPITTISITGEDGRKESEAEKRRSRGSFELVDDVESLRLIKELQAEEYGLRRRGKG